MKLFKDVAVGESFVLHNGQQLIRKLVLNCNLLMPQTFMIQLSAFV